MVHVGVLFCFYDSITITLSSTDVMMGSLVISADQLYLFQVLRKTLKPYCNPTDGPSYLEDQSQLGVLHLEVLLPLVE